MTTAATPTRRAPSPPAWSRKTRSTPCSAAPSPAPAWRCAIFRGSQNPVYRACRRGRDRGSGAQMGVQDAAHRADVLRQDLRGSQEAQPDQDRHDLGHRRLGQGDARRMPQDGAAVRHHRDQGRNLRRGRQRHDAATHQHQEHRRRAGGDQLRLRPGPGDRHAQLSPARHRCAALPEPRRVVEELHQPGGAGCWKACACRPRRCWSPTSCPTTIR